MERGLEIGQFEELYRVKESLRVSDAGEGSYWFPVLSVVFGVFDVPSDHIDHIVDFGGLHGRG